jgi:hypothetical protein
MTIVTIYFVGLIAHLSYTPSMEPTRQVAALVKQTDHHPELIVPTGAVLKSRNTFTLSSSANGLDHYDISGATIQILGVAGGEMQPPGPKFRDVVNLVKATTKPNLKTTVTDENKTEISTYVELQGGQLDVAGYYSKKGKHDTAVATVRCIPSLIQFKTAAAGGVIEFVGDNGKHLRVVAGTPIYIGNLSSTATSHFDAFANLMIGGSGAGTWTTDAADCTETIFDPADVGAKGVGLECTNTTFP